MVTADEEVFGAREMSLLERDTLGHNSFREQSGRPREAKTSYAGLGNSHARRRGKGGGVSVSVTAPLLSLSRSQCLLRTQSAPIPTVSHLLRLLFSATTESYFDPLSLILHFCLLYIALLSPSFSERPPSLSDVKVDRLQFGKEREGGIES